MSPCNLGLRSVPPAHSSTREAHLVVKPGIFVTVNPFLLTTLLCFHLLLLHPCLYAHLEVIQGAKPAFIRLALCLPVHGRVTCVTTVHAGEQVCVNGSMESEAAPILTM